jgi:hypothetical protein
MARTRQQATRSGRSNLYSASKFTNWAPFDPYYGERAALPRDLRPTTTFAIADSQECHIYERPIHEAFVRPCSAADVKAVLAGVPRGFLRGLDAVYVMGGTWKQDKVALSDLYRYGEYGWGAVYLFAFPRRRLDWRCKRLPKPAIRQEYERAGARFERVGGGSVCRFDLDSLRRFYLYDVLIHEVGHHVDRFSRGKPYARGERFAEWFVREHGGFPIAQPESNEDRSGS